MKPIQYTICLLFSVRGRWKPLKPDCSLIPCSIASTGHATYSIITRATDENGKGVMQPLNTFDEIQNGESIEITCDEGYSIQGPARLKCIESSWDVTSLPECIPAICSLPAIDHAIYQVKTLCGISYNKLLFYSLNHC